MVDREKVICNLGILRTWCAVNPKYDMGLSVDDCRKSVKWIDDALALLKAQEPRVMTLSGVRNLKESTPVWLEDVYKKDVIGALFMRDYSGTKCVDFAIVRDWNHECVTANYMDYGIRWRCWTSRPTDEQREATPWD